MEKQKKILMLLMVLVFLMINYIVYNFYFKGKLEQVKNDKAHYIYIINKIDNIENEQAKLKKIEVYNEKLKRDVKILDIIAPKYIDTPQLAYDFYLSCLKFGVKGEELKFQLDDENVNKNSSKNSETDSSNNKNSQGNNLKKLTVDLKISGNKNNIEKYLKNLHNITQRRLNVKTVVVSLNGYEDKQQEKSSGVDKTTYNYKNNGITLLSNNGKYIADGGGILTNEDIESGTSTENSGHNFLDNFNNKLENSNSMDSNTQNQDINIDNSLDNFMDKDLDNIQANIVFYQYIQGDGESFDNSKRYDFSNESLGFDSIADMFK